MIFVLLGSENTSSSHPHQDFTNFFSQSPNPHQKPPTNPAYPSTKKSPALPFPFTQIFSGQNYAYFYVPCPAERNVKRHRQPNNPINPQKTFWL
jgi:hypothetical protein